jgi:hypothetical protein
MNGDFLGGPTGPAMLMQFTSFMLLLNDATKFIVGDGFVKFPMGYFNQQELGLPRLGPIDAHNLLSNSHTVSDAIIHTTNDCESKKFIRAKMGYFQVQY